MKFLNRCPECNSLWVRWNYLYSSPGTIKIITHTGSKSTLKHTYTHECLVCGNTFETNKKVKLKISLRVLKLFYRAKYLLVTGRF